MHLLYFRRINTTQINKIGVNNVWSYTIGFLIKGSSFKILFVMVVTMWQCYVLILTILLLSMLKGLIIFVLSLTLTNLKQFIFQKILCLMVVGIYKMHAKEISIKNQLYNCYSDSLVKANKLETKNNLMDEKTLKISCFILLYMFTVSQ